jgi:hypothetical protein
MAAIITARVSGMARKTSMVERVAAPTAEVGAMKTSFAHSTD